MVYKDNLISTREEGFLPVGESVPDHDGDLALGAGDHTGEVLEVDGVVRLHQGHLCPTARAQVTRIPPCNSVERETT